MRLTNALKLQLRNVLLDKKFKPLRATLRIRQEALGDRYYDYIYTPAMQAAMTVLPPDSLPSTEQFQGFALSAERFQGYRYLYSWRLTNEDEAALPAELLAEVKAVEVASQALLKKENDMREKIDGALLPITTDKKLYEVWPAVTKVALKVFGDQSTGNLPAVIPESLNAELELP